MSAKTPFSVELDDDSVARLLALSQAVGKPPRVIAAELLESVLADDEVYNGPVINHPLQ